MKVTLFIIFLGLLTIAPSIYYGNKLFDGKITEKPYETGLDYNKINHIIEDNGLSLQNIKAERVENRIKLNFAMTDNGHALLKDVKFFVERPATTSDTHEIKTLKSANGTYTAVFDEKGYGNFILEAQADVNGTHIAFQKNFYIAQ